MATKRGSDDVADEPADQIDALYALPASEFVAARNALAKRLKAEKRKDEAAEVSALRKPTVVAWALNQVARDDPEAVAILVDAAQAVADAQRAVMEGGDARALRAASAAQRGAAAEVVEPAVRLAGANNADAVTATLDAALADEQLTGRLRAGTLTETLDAPAGFGFGFAVGDAPAPPRRRAAGGRAGSGAEAAPTAKGKGRLRGAPTTDELAERRARAEARREVARLEKELARAEDAVAAATSAHRDAVAAADEAQEELATAQRRAADATEARDEAAAALDDASRARDRWVSALEAARAD
jgi:hypothetical protein